MPADIERVGAYQLKHSRPVETTDRNAHILSAPVAMVADRAKPARQQEKPRIVFTGQKHRRKIPKPLFNMITSEVDAVRERVT